MFETILGILISILGLLIILYRILDNSKADNVFDKSFRGQLYVIGIFLIIIGITYAIRG